MQLLCVFIFLQLLLLLIIIKAAFPEINGISPEKIQHQRRKKSRSVERSNTYPDVSKAEIKKK